jgi:hypothetical protein
VQGVAGRDRSSFVKAKIVHECAALQAAPHMGSFCLFGLARPHRPKNMEHADGGAGRMRARRCCSRAIGGCCAPNLGLRASPSELMPLIRGRPPQNSADSIRALPPGQCGLASNNQACQTAAKRPRPWDRRLRPADGIQPRPAVGCLHHVTSSRHWGVSACCHVTSCSGARARRGAPGTRL